MRQYAMRLHRRVVRPKRGQLADLRLQGGSQLALARAQSPFGREPADAQLVVGRGVRPAGHEEDEDKVDHGELWGSVSELRSGVSD